jgi:protein-disulfide isomerase
VPTLEQVLETYPEKVKLVFKHFPLNSHKFALKAAIASHAAGNQGKFWEFHDALFKDYKTISDEKIQQIAADLALDMEKFNLETKSPEIQAVVRKDLADGREAGVRGTPTVFINGRKLKGRGLNGFRNAIDRELKDLSEKGGDSDNDP